MSTKPKLSPGTALSLLRELRSSGDLGPIVVDGARELVPPLARGLRAGGEASAVREGGDPAGAAALVWVGEPDEDRLRRAANAAVPIVGLTEGDALPYVLDTDLVLLRAGEALPVERVAAALAHRLGPRGPRLAARLPVLREPVVHALIAAASRRNGFIAAAVWVPGVDMPILTLNQLRLVLQIAIAHGEEVGAARLPEVAGVVGAALGFRTLARSLLGAVPVAGWPIRVSIAYAGTRGVGEAARLRFATSDQRP